jgi:3-oxoacyl-[acyl-carrier-protein] synthase II
MSVRIAVTGIGLLTPAGCTPDEVLKNLRLGQGGIRPVESFDTQSFVTKYAGEVTGFVAEDHFSPCEMLELDRATQLGIVAARQAWSNAGPPLMDPKRVALVNGMTGSGQYQNAHFTRTRELVEGVKASFFHVRNTPHFQTTNIARRLGVRGPVLTFTGASGGSTLAICHAMNLLKWGRASIVVAGGSESLTISSVVAMDSLQLSSSSMCSPFSGNPGMTLGEGAAYLVLEPYDQACRRGANILAELLGSASRADGFDSVASDPSGQGIARTMAAALKSAAVNPAQIAWIKASGCSTRDQDLAETIAIRQVFGQDRARLPVTSLESSFGHASGASGAIGLAAAILCRNDGTIPATLNFSAPRAGCDLDYVPNLPRRMAVNHFIANSIAFGGGNSAVVVAAPQRDRLTCENSVEEVAITGIGIISPFGCGKEPFLSALQKGQSGIAKIERFHTDGTCFKQAGLVNDCTDASHDNSLKRLPALQRFATAAISGAMCDAGLVNHRLPQDRVGLFVALSRGPAEAQEHFFRSLSSGTRGPAMGKAMLKMGRFHVTSSLARTFHLRGFCATISDGATAGLHALIHARDVMRSDRDHDAMIVVAADELGPLFLRVAEDVGFLAADGRSCPYDLESHGTILGEGAVAVVVERLADAKRRNASVYAVLHGCGLTHDAVGYMQVEPNAEEFGRAIDLALSEAAIAPDEIDLVYGHGRGIPEYDRREIDAFQARFRQSPVSCVTATLGLGEASCGLFSVAAAAIGLQRDEVYPLTNGVSLSSLPTLVTSYHRLTQRNVLVAGGTESGNNAALVLSRDGLSA